MLDEKGGPSRKGDKKMTTVFLNTMNSLQQTKSEDERIKMRKFKYCIKNIVAKFEEDVSLPFFSFQVGGLFSEHATGETTESLIPAQERKEKAQIVQGQQGRENKEFKSVVTDNAEEEDLDESGDDEKEETESKKSKMKKEDPLENVELHDAEVISPPTLFYTRCKDIVFSKVKGQEIVWHHSFEGVWTNSYLNLITEELSIYLMSRRWWGSSGIIGKHTWSLRECADGDVRRVAEIRKNNRELFATISFDFEFSEVFTFEIKFDGWSIEPPDFNVPDYHLNLEISNVTFSPLNMLKSLYEGVRYRLFGGHVPASSNPLSCLFPLHQLPPLFELGDQYLGEPECIVGLDTKMPSRILFQGTRRELENSQLQIRLERGSRVANMCNISQLTGAVSLEDRVEYGYIDGELEKSKTEICMPSCLSAPVAKISYMGNIGFTGKRVEPKYRQHVSSDSSKTGNRFTLQDGKFLRVHLIQAKRLSSLEGYEESLNPFVAVQWMDITKRSSVRYDSSDPEWNEYLNYQLIDSRADDKPLFLRFIVWHRRGFFTNSLLGSAVVYIHDIPPENVHYRAGITTTYILTHKVKLDTHGYIEGKGRKPPFLEFELEIHQDIFESRLQAMMSQQIKEEPLETNLLFFDLRLEWQRRVIDYVKNMQDRWHLPRYFHCLGVDEMERNIHYLPSFLSRLLPPRELVDIDAPYRVLHYVYSMEFYQKKFQVDHTPWDKMMKSVRNKKAMSKAERDYHPYSLGLWADPHSFLSKGRGDFKDHALLLCSFFFGLGMEAQDKDDIRSEQAYVCLGSVRSKSGGARFHAWVMTIRPRSRGLEPSAITFWEPSNGFVYRVNPINPQRPHVLRTQLMEEKKEAAMRFLTSDEKKWDPIKSQQVPPQSTTLRDEFKHFVSLKGPDSFSVRDIDLDQELDEDEKTSLLPTSSSIPSGDFTGSLPYLSLDVIFNRRYCYANLAPDPHPERLSYQLPSLTGGEIEQSYWHPVRFDREKVLAREQMDPLASFYNTRLVLPKASKEQCLKAEKAIQELLKEQIFAHREQLRLRTNFCDMPTNNLLQQRLRIEEAYGWRKFDPSVELRMEVPEVNQILAKKRSEWREQIVNSNSRELGTLPSGCELLDKLYFFKHADPHRIAATILQTSNVQMIEMPDNYHPHFAVAAKIQRYASSVCPCRLIIAVVHKQHNPAN